MNSPRISVLIPICNVEKYLDECLSSVQKQTFSDMEVICINDGSRDDSKAIIERYLKSDSRFILIDKENSGYGDSMNRGLAKARGEYIAIVESDDFIAPEMFTDLYAMTDGGTVDIVKGNFWDYYENEETKKQEAIINKERTMIHSSAKAFTLQDIPQMIFGHPSIWSAIYRREFLESHQIRFMCEPGGGWVDNPFFFETLILAKSVKWTTKPYYYYRKTNANSSSNRQPDLTLPLRRMCDNLDVVEKYNVRDREILIRVYSRALMYLWGVLDDPNHLAQIDAIKKWAVTLFSRLDESIIDDHFNDRDKNLFYSYRASLSLVPESPKKVLIYNWIQFDNPFGFGGGVNIYCKNLIETIIRQRPDVEIYFLSSGFAYDATTTDCYIRPTFNIYTDRCKSFEIINSPVPAAQDRILNKPEISFCHPELRSVFLSFIAKYGAFDVIHFNNIEGLSLDCLNIKKELPTTKLIYSIHNYIPFCVHGFYFDRNKKCVCNPQHTADDCLKCICACQGDLKTEWDLYQRASKNVIGKCIEKNAWIKQMGFSGLDGTPNREMLMQFCKRALSVLNENMDMNLAVSECVKRIAIENGFNAKRIKVSYIGTKVAQFPQPAHYQLGEKTEMTVVFLGANYHLEEKGYPFLMEALSGLEKEYASQIHLVLTTTNGDEAKMKEMLKQFKAVTIIHGYTHSDLRNILKDADLGIVPVLWEDNLPQIAIEMVANGVPVLSSNLGGASELCDSDLFRFIGGSTEDFKKHLVYFVNNRDKLNEFWTYSKQLVTMSMHWDELEEIYELPQGKPPVLTFEDYKNLEKELDVLRFIARYATNPAAPVRRKWSIGYWKWALGSTVRSLNEFGLAETLKKIAKKVEKKIRR